jgi:S-formylglutathione hydrolase FrmB
LLPENLIQAAQEAGKTTGEDALNVRFQNVSDVLSLIQFGEIVGLIMHLKDYDHSYYFISTFGADHINYHAKFLGL